LLQNEKAIWKLLLDSTNRIKHQSIKKHTKKLFWLFFFLFLTNHEPTESSKIKVEAILIQKRS
jgi:hypothetical protein